MSQSRSVAISRQEFTVAGAYQYNRSGAGRWIASHLLRYKRFVAGFVLAAIVSNAVNAAIPVLTGNAFTAVQRRDPGHLLALALTILTCVVARGLLDTTSSFCDEFLGKRFERDARDELYASLLGKSQTFHNRQRVGDIMARAANDVTQINNMVVPGFDLLLGSLLGLVVPIIYIGLLNAQLLLAPLLFTAVFALALRRYVRTLQPVAGGMRMQFGAMNAELAETVTGIDVVKSTAQEPFERQKFERNARRYRDLFVRNGQIQARYLPPLLVAIAIAGAFVHGLFLVTHHQLSVGGLVSYMGLMGLLRFPAFISIFTFSLAQFGFAAAERIITLLREETELDENEGGYCAEMRGEITFEDVTFGYGDTPGAAPALRDVSFSVTPGQTVAIVGQTGSGKSTLTKLVNRIYDASSGRVLVDGVDVRDWSLDALRSQISTIEQDITLFSRPIAENIAFSRGGALREPAVRAEIEAAARDAQAHEFITSFKEGYDTVVGERGSTLSGGQRQRLAIARALLKDPPILILDEATSALDAATEARVSRAMATLMKGRTTFIIAHRLSTIRDADTILVFDSGRIVESGNFEELVHQNGRFAELVATQLAPQSALAAE